MRLSVVVALLLAGSSAPAAAQPLAATLSDWGGAGLLQNPTARSLPTDTLAVGGTLIGGEHRHDFATVQLFPWLETTLRASRYSGYYGLVEPGVDVKLRLWPEGEWWPEVAIGGRDVTGSGYPFPGSGRFAGEYLVATRRWYDFDLTLGLGWGRLGGYAHLPNPLRPLGGRYTRDRDPHDSGSRGPGAWFSGTDVAVFGGVEWRTPVDGLSLKLEYSGDSFRAEQEEFPGFEPGLPVNAGLAWRPLPWIDVAAGLEQGRRAMVRLALRAVAGDLVTDAPAPPPPVSYPAPRGNPGAPERIAGIALSAGLPVRATAVGDGGATVWLDPAGADGAPLARTVGRAARVLAEAVPPGAERLTVVTGSNGVDGVAVTLDRNGVAAAANARGSAEELWRTVAVEPAAAAGAPPDWRSRAWQRLAFTIDQSPFEQGMSWPFRSYLDASAGAEPWPGLILDAGLRRTVAHTLGGLDTWAFPGSAPVRSDLPLYAAARATVDHLYAAWRAEPVPGWAVGATLGHMEEMFGGLGAEILHQPFRARWAFGLDVNRVWKRPPWELIKVDATSGRYTGHLTAYWEGAGPDAWSASLALGRYLGGDWGATLALGRVFDNGVRLDAHFSWTDGARPGQSPLGGRADQGIRLSIPFGELASLLPDASARTSVRTLGRDVGQRLERPLPLHDTAMPARFGRLAGTWTQLLK